MKSLLIAVLSFLIAPVSLQAQTASNLLIKVSDFLIQQKWNEAIVTFRQAIIQDVSMADTYYHKNVDSKCEAASPMAKELADYYKDTRNYEQAYTYYKELLQTKPNDTTLLSACAESAFGKGKEEEAVNYYKKILSINPNNLQGNIFVGSYYFMSAEEDKKQLDKVFHKITTPTSMQKAHYKDQLKELLTSKYFKAKVYLLKVVKLFPSTEAKRMLDIIAIRHKDVENNK